MSYSSFLLCDLQVHTIADPKQHYGSFNGEKLRQQFAEKLVLAHKEAGVSVFAVTDHNLVDWYPLLKTMGDVHGVYVFPGLEVSVNGCHLLMLWDRTDQGYQLAQQFLPTLWEPGAARFRTNGDPIPVSSGQVLDVAKRAVQHRALVFAPHSTLQKMGLFASGVCRNSNEIAQSDLITGFDVMGNRSADVLRNPRCEFGDQAPRWFATSDSRGFEEVGKRAVYLKLSIPPTLEGIRQAFVSPESRIRFPECLMDEWGSVKQIAFLKDPTPRWPHISDLTIKGGFHDGLVVEFGPGLNAIIGGKGTGKSTIIEILRYALDATPPIKELASELEGNRLQNFRANAEAQVTFVTGAEEQYCISRSGGSASPRLTRNGTAVDSSLVQKRARIRVFGQRELQSYAQDAGLRREFVAWHAGHEWEQVFTAERNLRSRIESIEGIISSLETQIAQIDDLRSQLADLEERLERARERGVEELFGRSETLERINSDVLHALSWPRRVSSQIGELGSLLPAPPVSQDDPIRESLAGLLGELEASLQSAHEHLSRSFGGSTGKLEKIRADWTAKINSERGVIMVQLEEAGFHDLGELSANQQEASAIRRRIEQLSQIEDQVAEKEGQRSKLVDELEQNRRHQSRLIERAARALTTAVGNRVRVRIEPLSDPRELLSSLSAATKGRGVRREQLERLCSHGARIMAKAICEGAPVVQKLGCTATTANILASLPPAMVRQLERVPLLDKIMIEINVGSESEEKWVDVDKASPGQRATAMLALALSSGSEPLIIDQPEDDLDNRFIYEEVVKLISRVCTSRQVIVATHNANIPVLGDAEMILALDAGAEAGRVLAQGGIEDIEVAYHVRHILEGGDEAFKARQSRYQSSHQKPRLKSADIASVVNAG